MKKPLKSKPAKGLLFDLTDAGSNFRSKWRGIVVVAIWLLLSGVSMIFTVFSAESKTHKLILIVMSLIKYIPLMMVVYNLSRNTAAKYLGDVYEIDDEEIASKFLEHATFGHSQNTSPLITIKNGEIADKDEEESSLILIGGPGYIQVNLDSVALLEKANGEPKVIHPRKEAWKLDTFERIREIGESDQTGEREYAIINLREQITRNISVKSRTKDGIPVEAHNITMRFNILRSQGVNESETFSFEERAVQTLVYEQTTIIPQPPDLMGAGFPWNTTIIPLVISEIERVITSHTTNEILASIGQKEMDIFSTAEQTAAQIRVEITGKQQAYTGEKKGLASKSISRATITEQFHQPPFTQKAAALGVQLNWIDIGTWEPSGPIRDKIRNAWKVAADNIQKQGMVAKWKKQYTDEEILGLIDNVVISFSEKINDSSDHGKEKVKQIRFPKDISDRVARNPEMMDDPDFVRLYTLNNSNKKSPLNIAFEMLRAFRKELLAGQELIEEKEKLTVEEKQADLEKIKKTLDSINTFFPHPQKKPS